MKEQSGTDHIGELHDGETIRLLKLQPGLDEEPIVVHLNQCRLDGAEPYEALSYVWGNATDTKPIMVLSGGETIAIEHPVTKNCYAALKRLRKATQPRTLWIDAICIDQKSDHERTSQLPLIPHIYAQASQVLVHLGEATQETNTALDYIRSLDDPVATPSAWQATKAMPSLEVSMPTLFQMPWFHRIWVLQEIHFAEAAIVICGNKEVNWENFKALKDWNESRYYANRSSLPFSVQWLTGIQTGDRYRSFASSVQYPRASFAQRLLRMLSESRACGATDPRDKFFAVLPLISGWYGASGQATQLEQAVSKISQNEQQDDTNVPSIWFEEASLDAKPEVRIDRQYHTPVATVFTNLAEDLIDAVGMAVLGHVAGSPSAIPGLPSWAPDWSIERRYHPLRGGRTHGEQVNIYSNPVCPTDSLLSKAPKPLTKSWYFTSYDIAADDLATSSSAAIQVSRRQLHSSAVSLGRIAKIGPIADIEKDYLPLGIWRSLILGRDDLLGPVYQPCTYSSWHKCSTDCGEAQVPVFVRTLFGDLIHRQGGIKEALLNVEARNKNEKSYYREYHDEHRGEPSEFWSFLSKPPVLEPESAEMVEPSSESAGLYALYKRLGPSPGYWIRRLFSMCHGSRFFVLEGEHGGIGLAQWNAQVGDEVVKLEDSSDLFLVRNKAVAADRSEPMAAGSKVVEFVGKGFMSRLEDLVAKSGAQDKIELVIR